MKQRMELPASPPPRKELSDTPVKFCNEISRLFRAYMRQNDPTDGVMSQPGAHLVLSVLAIYDGINQRELVKRTHLRPPTVSVILKKMEGEGIVTLECDEKDRRAVCVHLTREGRALDRSNLERIRKLDAVALRGLSEREIALLMELLPKIRDNLLLDSENDEKEDKM